MSEEDKKKKDDTRRFADLHLQAQIPVMAHRLTALEQTVKDKFDNGINIQLNKIYDKINELQCGVHAEQIKNIAVNTENNLNTMDTKVNGLYVAFAVVFLAEIATIVISIMTRKGG